MIYSTKLEIADTFKYPQWSGDKIIAKLADCDGKRYLYIDEGIDLPTSVNGTYSKVAITLELILTIMKSTIGITERLTEMVKVYNTTDAKVIEVPRWALVPEGYTDQVPREFDKWDGSLWITDMALRNATLKKRKLAEINNDLETALAALRVEYPESEIMSWTKQETEARAWLRDNTRATPLIDLIASQRGLDKALLINKVIEKSDQYSFAVGSAIGRRQMLEDQVKLVEVGKESKLDQIKF